MGLLNPNAKFGCAALLKRVNVGGNQENQGGFNEATWPAPGSEDTELGVLMESEVDHGEAEVYTRVQA